MNERTFKHSDAHKLEDPGRKQWLPPDEILGRLGLRAGLRVADIGAGTGYFAIPIAQAVGERGKVLAVDLQPEMLALLRSKLTGLDAPANVELFGGTAHETTLPAACCDLVLMANLWHELDDRPGAIAEAGRILVPGGRLAILDWHPGAVRPPGPPLEERVTIEETVRSLEKAGWSVLDAAPVALYTYLVIAAAPGQGV